MFALEEVRSGSKSEASGKRRTMIHVFIVILIGPYASGWSKRARSFVPRTAKWDVEA